MYDDYPTIYETTLNDNLIYFIILAVILLIIIIITLIALAKVFKKANRSGISAFIPIYNMIMLLEITNTPKFYILLLLIPGVNIIANVFVMLSLAKLFRKSQMFGFGLAFLPFVFYPILAFGNSEYIGINLTALGGKTSVADIPKSFQPEEKDVIIHEEQDKGSKDINISIGGGVYQKDYTKSLLDVDKQQAIPNMKAVELIPKTADPTRQTFIKPVEEEPIPEPEPTAMGIEFPNQVTDTEPVQVEPIVENNEQTDKEQPKIEVADNHLLQNSEYISCPKCGAKIKRGVKACFLCGRRLD